MPAATKKMAILTAAPQALRQLLHLPDECEIVRVEMDPYSRGGLRLVVEGVGWDVQEGHPIASAGPSICNVKHSEDGKLLECMIDWGLPGSYSFEKYEEVERPITLASLRRAARALSEARPDFSRPLRVRLTTQEAVELGLSGTQEATAALPGFVCRARYGDIARQRVGPHEIGRVELWAIDVFDEEPA